MENYFIKNILVKDVRDIQNLDIPLDEDERKHLIITGKNGCGKTSLLIEMNNLMTKIIYEQYLEVKNHQYLIESWKEAIAEHNKQIAHLSKQIELLSKEKIELLSSKIDSVEIYNVSDPKLQQIDNNIESYQANLTAEKKSIINAEKNIQNSQKEIEDFSKVDVAFSNQNGIYENIVSRKFILAFFEAKRQNAPTISSAIQNINLKPNYGTNTTSLHTQFIQYIVKLRADMLDAKEENENEEVERIQNWFNNFENNLKELFEEDDLKLKYYRKELNFKIEYNNKSFGLNELSDGYSSLLAILTELILRMEAHGVKVYDMQGVVLIDEIETHLHIDLQKKVLPFLAKVFPQIQFVVTTHSPFVLSSLPNAVICDLEKRFITTDLSAYSYDALIESYFDSDKYSDEIKSKVAKFELLAEKEKLSDDEKDEYYQLKNELKAAPSFMADELSVKINQILLKNFKIGDK